MSFNILANAPGIENDPLQKLLNIDWYYIILSTVIIRN